MKLWIALIILALLVAPKALADDAPSTPEHDAEQQTHPDSAEGQPTPERQAIAALLSHHHDVPDRAALEDAADDPRQVVFEIARDDDSFVFHRQRALNALTHWPDEEVYDYLVGLLDDDSTEDGLRHHLLPIVADGFGDDALDAIEPYLVDADDPQIRMSAAAAIAEISSDDSRQLLQDALEVEEHPVVSSRLRTHLDEQH